MLLRSLSSIRSDPDELSSTPSVEQRARAFLQKAGAHRLDFARDVRLLAELAHFLVEPRECRLGAGDLFVIGAQLRMVLRLAIAVEIGLQPIVMLLIGVVGRRELERSAAQLGRIARDLRVQARRLLTKRRDVGLGEGRIERRQDVAFGDPIALAHVQASHYRRVERLDHDRSVRGDDLSGNAGHDAVKLADDGNHAKQGQGNRDHVDRQPRGDRIGRLAKIGHLRLKAPDIREGFGVRRHGRRSSESA